MSNLDLIVRQTNLSSAADDTYVPGRATRLGLQVVSDFYQYMALAGAGFQVRLGTITTPIVGDVVLTDQAAEMAINALLGYTVIPVEMDLSIRLGTGTLHEYAIKSVAAAATIGTGAAFTPLPLLLGGSACAATAFTGTAGSVTVAAEAITTTRRHWAYSNPVAVGAGHDAPKLKWEPRMPPIIKGVGSVYLQVAATGTGPSYYASFNFIEAPTASLL